ncbi:hypothetical protein PR048_015742 [Dryococelus australis]|uniref:Uncharacterized protein n=1 Tax=Dryococelus australis TaxID=614101 RepID=A0ABQ9HHT0_9NEOP|nr:hypothetical protein PR048_015742 [Dryococelus australis]
MKCSEIQAALASSAGMQGRRKREVPEETRRPIASPGTIPKCRDPGATPMRIETGSPRSATAITHEELLERIMTAADLRLPGIGDRVYQNMVHAAGRHIEPFLFVDPEDKQRTVCCRSGTGQHVKWWCFVCRGETLMLSVILLLTAGGTSLVAMHKYAPIWLRSSFNRVSSSPLKVSTATGAQHPSTHTRAGQTLRLELRRRGLKVWPETCYPPPPQPKLQNSSKEQDSPLPAMSTSNDDIFPRSVQPASRTPHYLILTVADSPSAGHWSHSNARNSATHSAFHSNLSPGPEACCDIYSVALCHLKGSMHSDELRERDQNPRFTDVSSSKAEGELAEYTLFPHTHASSGVHSPALRRPAERFLNSDLAYCTLTSPVASMTLPHTLRNYPRPRLYSPGLQEFLIGADYSSPAKTNRHGGFYRRLACFLGVLRFSHVCIILLLHLISSPTLITLLFRADQCISTPSRKRDIQWIHVSEYGGQATDLPISSTRAGSGVLRDPNEQFQARNEEPKRAHVREVKKTPDVGRLRVQLSSHHGEPGSIPDEVTSGFSHVGIVQDDASGRWVLSLISHFPHSCIPALLHTHLVLPSRAFKTSVLRAAQISSLAH